MTSKSDDSDRSADTWRKRRKVDEIFGDDLPGITSDECDQGHKGTPQDWFEANRPPHYE